MSATNLTAALSANQTSSGGLSTEYCNFDDVNQNVIAGYFSLVVTCMASWKIAFFVSDNKRALSLPRGSGFLLTGLLAGTFGMVKATTKVCKIVVLSHPDGPQYDETQQIFFPINYVCMAFIAYATGSELRIERYRKLFKKISIVSSSIVLWVFLIVTFIAWPLFSVSTFFDANEYITKPDQSPGRLRLASAALVGAILTSRSPASAISIIGEMRAKGIYTQLSLGVTIFMYFIVNFVFAIMDAGASIIIGESDTIAQDIGRVFISLILSVIVGIMMGFVLFKIAGLRFRKGMKKYLRVRSPMYELYIKAILALALGFGVFMVRMFLSYAQKTAAKTQVKITIVPLLACLVSGVFVTNYKKCLRAEDFGKMCKSIAPYVYCSFFTLVGASINFQTSKLPVAVTLALIRIFGVVVGAYAGGFLAREPFKRSKFSPMNYVTQAGVALGFAEELKARSQESDSWLSDYGALGTDIYTIIAMVVVSNQLIGPPLYKLALRLSGDAFIDRIGGANLITCEGQTPQIQIKKVGWEVRAGVGGSRVAAIVPGRSTNKLARTFHEHQLPPLLGDATPDGPASNMPFICMLEDDAANYEACKLMQRLYGVRRCIVQQIDPKWKSKFNEIGGLVLDPDAIVVEPLQQFIGSAQSAAMLLHLDRTCEVVRVFIDQDGAGLTIAQCGLPKDVQVLELRRHKTAIVPRAFTKLQFEDELMLCGRPSSLGDVTAIKKGRVALLTRARQGSRNRMMASGSSGGPSLAADETTVLYTVSPFEDEAAADVMLPAPDRGKRGSVMPGERSKTVGKPGGPGKPGGARQLAGTPKMPASPPPAP